MGDRNIFRCIKLQQFLNPQAVANSNKDFFFWVELRVVSGEGASQIAVIAIEMICPGEVGF